MWAVEFQPILPDHAEEAHRWHCSHAGQDGHMILRPLEEFKILAEQGQAWCAVDHTGSFLGLAYYIRDDDKWEIGGLVVAPQERESGLGSVLARLTLGALLFVEDPLTLGHTVVAHVHAENRRVQPLLEKVFRFKHAGKVTRPGALLQGMTTNADGLVEGEEFHLVKPDSLLALADWCDSWKESLRDGRRARITLGPPGELSEWAAAFRQMAGD